MTALPLYLPQGENLALFLCRNTLPPHMGNHCPYTENPLQAVSSLILNPNLRTFWIGRKDSADRTTPPPGNSAYRNGHRWAQPLQSLLYWCLPFLPRKNDHSGRHFLLRLISRPAPGASSAGQACPGFSVPRTPVSRPPAAPGWKAFSPA